MKNFEQRGDRFFDAHGQDITELVESLNSHYRRVRAGEQTSPAKARAARKNGKLGGRPKGSRNKPKQ